MKRAQDNVPEPLAVTIPEAARISGYSEGSIWAFIRKGRLRAIRVEGHRRTLVDYASLKRLLDPEHSAPAGAWYCPAGRPGKAQTKAATEALREVEA
jgi:hypothetical protein